MSKLRTKKWFSPYWTTNIFILLMVGGLPLWFWRGGYTDLTSAKFAYVAILTGLWAVSTAVTAMGTKNGISMSADKWILVLLILCAGISSALSPYPDHVWLGSGRYNGFLSLVIYGSIYIGVSSYGRMRKSYVIVFMAALFACCVVSLFQLVGKNPFGLYPGTWNYYDKGIQYSSEFLGNVGNIDLFGALLCLGIPLAMGTVMYDNGKGVRMLVATTAVCVFVAVVMDVKATLLGTAAGLTVHLVAGLMRREPEIRKRTGVLFMIVALTVILANVLSFSEQGISLGNGQEQKNAVTESSEKADLGNILEGKWNDEIGSGRIGIWKTLLKTVPQHMWIGTGPGTVADRADIVYERYVPETGRTLKARVDNAHNEFLEYLVCEGTIGLLLYLLLLMVTCVRNLRSGRTEKKLLLTAMGSYWIQSFFGLGLILVLPIVFVFWGLLNQSEK